MAYKDKEKQLEAQRAWYIKNKERARKQHHEYYLKHREETIQRTKKYRQEKKESSKKISDCKKSCSYTKEKTLIFSFFLFTFDTNC